MQITKIEQQKRKTNRFNLEIDDEFCCGVDEALILELDLYKGKNITDKDIQTIREADNYKNCLNKAFTLLAIRMNSEIEIRKKLITKYSNDSVNKTIDRLKELGYVDDNLFVKSWVNSRECSRGVFMLKKELHQKGIHKDLIDEYFNNRDKENEFNNALHLVEKKRWPEMAREERFQKIGNYLSRRGFDYETIKKVINQ